jgi:hypothetical protein
MATNDASKMLSAGRQRPAHVTAVPDTPAAPEPVASATRQPVAESYVKISAFITPDQRDWLDSLVTTARNQGIKALSGSDFVRLALGRLQAEGTDVANLVASAIDQAHADAERFPGRKNRGLPQR